MSDFNGKPMNLESQRIIQMLIDKITFIYQSKNYKDEIEILERACRDTNIKLSTYFREDLSSICYYSCQLILNENICIVCGTGNCKKNSYENAIRKFLNHCIQTNQLSPIFMENKSSFVDDLAESYNNLRLVDRFIDILKEYIKENTNKIDYKSVKVWLEYNQPDSRLSESIFVSDNCCICSIYLNEELLLQQGRGENNVKSLTNTFTEFLEAYSLTSNSNVECTDIKKIQEKKLIIKTMAEKFKENVLNSNNQWTTLEKCAQELGYDMAVQYANKSCSVNINDVEIIKVEKCDNDYCGYITTCKELVQLLEKTSTYNSPPKDYLGFSARRDFKSTCHGREEIIKSIVCKANNIIQKNQSSPSWTILNNAFLEENLKLELHYANSKSNAMICSFDFQGLQIVSAEGDTKPSSREAAALKLLNDPSYSK